ncbi:unnamed protein product [Heligmosomoides polygyrus]|uniref:Endo/exonuclease/phosphatase domain-containing protein n=1 Tax=Heligmosomoides polygyrus TaxID=6339 RepID=A0A3P8DPK9_HELPZ|nr:unnamed protein product [Heligmosomoides polygyrus]
MVSNSTWSVNQVIFGGDKKFNLDGPDGYRYYWRDLRRSYITFSRRNFGGGPLMTWAGLCSRRKLKLRFPSCRMDSLGNQAVLESSLLPFLTGRKRQTHVLQQDSTILHVSKSTTDWLKRNRLRVMEWPACSSDRNPMENILLDEKTAEVPSKDVIIVAGDLNDHVGATKDGNCCHGGFGYGLRNADGERILDYAESHNLTIVNTVFRKRDSHLISYYSGGTKTQKDFVLVKDRDRGLVTDAKVVPYETVAPQHRPLICTLKIAPPRLKQVERCGAARIKWWRMK